MHATDDTHPDWTTFLAAQGVPTKTASPAWDSIGLHRRRSLEVGLAHSTSPLLLYTDPDHILRWVERQPDDLDAILARLGEADCLVIGRSAAAFAAAPARLRETEAIVNHVYQLLTGNAWDLMMAARGLSRKAAELIVRHSTEDTIGNDVAWPLLVAERGLTLGYAQADGLTYEINTDYATGRSDSLDGDPASWMLRVYAANQQIDAMRPFLKSEF